MKDKDKIKQLEEQVALLNEQKTVAEKALEDANAASEVLKNTLAQIESGSADEALIEANKKIAELTASNDGLGAETTKMWKEIDGLKAEKDVLTDENEELKAEVAALKAAPAAKGPVSSIAPAKKEVKKFEPVTAEFDGKKYASKAPSAYINGKHLTHEEFMKDEVALKFLVEESFDRHGHSNFIKEVFE